MHRRRFLSMPGTVAIPHEVGTSLLEQVDPHHLPPIGDGDLWLNRNENPSGPCTAARMAVTDVLPLCGRYFPRWRDDLERRLCRRNQLLQGYARAYVGSTDALFRAFRAYARDGRSVVIAHPTYEPLVRFCQKGLRARLTTIPLASDLSHDTAEMVKAEPNPGVIYVCNPNNPTGTVTSQEKIRELLQQKPADSVAVVDEAYMEYTNLPSALEFVRQDEELIVLRTFSKIYGMAGLRCGVAFGRPDLLAELVSSLL